MKNELIIKRCNSCGATVKMIEGKDVTITCCGEEMKTVVANSVDAAVEKHVPTYEKVENEIQAKVNHVMEDEHYIEWISLVSENKEYSVKFKAGEVAEAVFPYIPGSMLYVYCNKHGLWSKEVE